MKMQMGLPSEGQTFLSFVTYIGAIISQCEICAWFVLPGVGSWFLEEGRDESTLAS